MTKKKTGTGKSKARGQPSHTASAATSRDAATGVFSANVLAAPIADKTSEARSTVSDHQRYATFTLELLLNEDDIVRRTRVAHVQSGEEQSWAGWDDVSVIAFITERAGFRSGFHEEDLFEPLEAATHEAAQLQPIALTFGISEVESAHTRAPHVSSLVLECGEAHGNTSSLQANQPYQIRLMLDFADDTSEAPERVYRYYAVVQAKQLGSQQRLLVARGRGTLTTPTNVIELAGRALPSGLYRLETGVRLVPLSPPGGRAPAAIDSWLEGGLLQVY
ncbi:MAG: hypothetical protein KatS3mg053_3666 [Candidatus Roseilinea sp.]|nr:MAG: hypothetical protein KatS3mg053_3666 [Candidatus Roseilinea sp.]